MEKVVSSALFVLAVSLLLVTSVNLVSAVSVGGGVSPDINTEDFAPLVWMCQVNTIVDDNTEPGRISGPGKVIVERVNNYAFEGERIVFTVLVMDKNGIEKVGDVFVSVGPQEADESSIEANCRIDDFQPIDIFPSCNARILEEELTEFDSETMAYYNCDLAVETPESMYGEYWVSVAATDLDGLTGEIDEKSYWFFNPIIGLSIDGDLTFEDVRPGTSSYSSTLLVENDADAGSGGGHA